MGGKAQLGSLFGIPIVIDSSFFLIVLLFGLPYLTAGDAGFAVYGLLLVVGIALSVLLHELGHALAGRVHGVPTSHVELNGLGGLCFYAGPQPRQMLPRIEMLLAGPFANFALWIICQNAARMLDSAYPDGLAIGGLVEVSSVLYGIAGMNFTLLWFNLLPAFPLDGGRTAAILLGGISDPYRGRWIIGWCGLAIAVYFAFAAVVAQNWWLLMPAFLLFEGNRFVIGSSGAPPWRRS
jgi:Zn-dependent protease